MNRTSAAAVAAIALALACASHAHAQFRLFQEAPTEGAPDASGGDASSCYAVLAPDAPRSETLPSGLFGSLGTHGRMWELRSDTALDSGRSPRTFAERVELAHAFSVSDGFAVIARASVATNASSNVAIQGPILSLGLKQGSVCDGSSIEGGFRVLFPFFAYGDGLPESQSLAFASMLASATGDDARWLSFADVGVQGYLSFRTRTRAPRLDGENSLYVGTSVDIVSSFMPLSIRTWLGVQQGLVANVMLDLYLGVLRVAHDAVNMQVGGHVEASLSGIWPAGIAFPLVAGGFVGWSPEPWLQLRIHLAAAGAAQGWDMQLVYGLRVQIFVP